MADLRPLIICCAGAGLLLVAGCGKPENAQGYMGGGSIAAADATDVKTPPPPPPIAMGAFMGRNIKTLTKGVAVCKGALDAVTSRHTGAQKGSEIEGWGWDERGARPLDKVLFVDAHDTVVGGAAVGASRIDVPKAVPEVKTPNVGWRGVADVVTDKVQALGVTTGGDTCVLGETTLG